MSIICLVALVALCGVVGTYLVLLGVFPPVRVDRVQRVLDHDEHMKIRAQYDAQTWKDWTGNGL